MIDILKEEKTKKNLAFYLLIIITNVLLTFYFLHSVFYITSIKKLILIHSMFFIASVFFIKAYHYCKKGLFENKVVRIVFILFLLYAAFGIVGNRLFLYPVLSKNVLISLLTYLLSILWILPIVLSLIMVFHKYAIKANKDSLEISKKRKLSIFIFCFVIIMSVGGIYLVAFNPAVTSYDTASQFLQAKGLVQIVDWQTPLHTLFLRVLLNIYDNPAFVSLVQCSMFAFVLAYGFTYLYEMGMEFYTVLIICAVVALIPSNAILSITIWKDVPYATSLLLLTILISKMVINPKKYLNSFWFYLMVFACLFLTSLLTQPGFVPAIIIAVFILILSKFNIKSLVTVGLFILSFILFTTMAYDHFEVKEPDYSGNEYIGLAHDLVGVKKYGGELSYEAEMIVETVLPDLDGVIDYYNPYRWLAAGLEKDLDITKIEFIEAYMDTFFENPILMTKMIMLRNNTIYSIVPSVYEGSDVFINQEFYYHENHKNSRAEPGIEALEFWEATYPDRISNRLTTILREIGNLSTKSPFRLFIWQVGVYFCAVFMSMILLASFKKLCYWVIAIPLIGQIIALCLSCAWNDFRYFWSIMVCSIYVVLISFVANKKQINFN